MEKSGGEIGRLLDIMRRLRAPGGCPWDLEQTLDSLKPCLLEEAYELLEAMTGGDAVAHIEELGDVLLQVIFQCAICEEQGLFGFEDVAAMLAEKLIRRHPHVFGGGLARTSDEVVRNWEAIKRGEKGRPSDRSALDGVPAALPALLQAQRVQAKAARVGFDWPDGAGAAAKVDEELIEAREALANGDPRRVEEEMGDLLFALVNTCRHAGVDAEGALRRATGKFSRRFREMEHRLRAQGRAPDACALSELDEIWEAVKQDERAAP